MLDSSEEKRRYYADRLSYRQKYLDSMQEAKALRQENAALKSQLDAMTEERGFYASEYYAVLNAFWWKLTAPFRKMVEWLRKTPEAPNVSYTTEWRDPPVSEEETRIQAELSEKQSLLFGIVAPEHSALLESSLSTQTYPHWQWGSKGSDYTLLLKGNCELHPYALSLLARELKVGEVLYCDELQGDNATPESMVEIRRCAYTIDALRSTLDLGALLAVPTALYERTADAEPCEQLLRICEEAEKVRHLPLMLYRRADAHAPRASAEGCRALEAHLVRQGLSGTVSPTADGGYYHISYSISDSPLVSIIIPNWEHAADLSVCLESIFAQSSYKNFEVIVVRNGKEGEEIEENYALATKKWPQLRVISFEGSFNFAAICNFGVRESRGEYVLLLNNDTEVLSHDWIQEMLMLAQRPDVGIVGAKLLYADETVQHCGMAFTSPASIEHLFRYASILDAGAFGCLRTAQEYTAVTGACMLLSRALYDELGGLDERFAVAYNDVDLCMKAREAGLKVLCTPFALLYHYEGKSRGDDDTPEKIRVFKEESRLFFDRWGSIGSQGDPIFPQAITSQVISSV